MSEEKFKSTSHIGKTVYYDLETNTSHTVPWGGTDWLLAAFLVVLFGSIAVASVIACVRFVLG